MATTDTDRTSVSRQLFRLSAELRRRAQLEMAEEKWGAGCDLRPLARAVLMMVDARGPKSQREISDALGLDPSDLVSMLDQLEDAGFTERRRDTDDRRRNMVVITAKGSKAAARLADVAVRAEAAALERLTERERDQLARLISRALGDD
jgi:DNA-binding MarR family transcriptional regulator